MEAPIEHVIVLMLENHPFDQILGGLARLLPDVEGAAPGRTNAGAGQMAAQAPGAAYSIARDLDHEHAGTMDQLAGGMAGFVASCQARYPDASAAELAQVMAYFDFGDTAAQDALPAIQGLARSFAVCDHWFSSMPGPTWQNRFFVHSGTCLGHLLMPTAQTPQDMRLYDQPTIFDRLDDAQVPWAIYHDGLPQSIVLTRMLGHFLEGRGYHGMDAFFAQAAGDPAAFPAYAFIEPCFTGAGENDQHPPTDIRYGEQLLAEVYNAIRSNGPLWGSALLVVLYDEHGGFYDHVPPPATVPPDGHTQEWGFDRLGVRVPALLVSPWVAPGVVTDVFDHTSLLRFLCEKWNLPPLGARMTGAAGDLQATTFASQLRMLDAPREDTPARIVALPVPPGTRDFLPPLEGSREALVLYVRQLEDRGDPAAQARLERLRAWAREAG